MSKDYYERYYERTMTVDEMLSTDIWATPPGPEENAIERREFSRKVNKEELEARRRQLLRAAIRTGTGKQQEKALDYLRGGKPARGIAYLVLDDCLLPGPFMARRYAVIEVVNITYKLFTANRHLRQLESHCDIKANPNAAPVIRLLLEGERR